MFQHHRRRPDLSDRIGDALARNIWRRAVNRLEQRGKIAGGVDVGRWCHTDGAGAGRAKIRQDVAEQVRGHDNIEPVRMQHEIRCQYVDVILVDINIRIGFRHFGDSFVPIGHGDRDAIRLGGRGEVLFRPALRKVEGKFQHPVHADAAHHRFLNDHFALGAGEHASPDR